MLFQLCDSCFFSLDSAVFVVSEFYDYIFIGDIDDNLQKPPVTIASPTSISFSMAVTCFVLFSDGSLKIHQSEHNN